MARDKKRKKHKKEKKEKKSKKSRRKDSSSDDSSSSDPGSSGDERDHKRMRTERKLKKVSARLREDRTDEIAGYTNEANPFNDPNLTQRFVWHKKIEKQIESGVDIKELGLRAEKKKAENRVKEIERVKQRRELREQEKVQMEEDLQLMNRERAIAEAVELEKKEEDFHLEQARQRSKIRLADGRGKPIDILSQNLNGDAMEFDLRSDDPTTVFLGLTHRELLDLKEDIRVQLELDSKEQMRKEFWQALMTVCEWEEAESSRRDQAYNQGKAPEPQYEAGLHAAVDKDVQQMLGSKNFDELVTTEDEIKDLLESGAGGETEYWDAILKRLKIYKARAKLKEIHTELRYKAHKAQEPANRAALEAAMGWNDGEPGPSGTADADEDEAEWVQLRRGPTDQAEDAVDYEEEEEDENRGAAAQTTTGGEEGEAAEENVGQWSPRYISSGFKWSEVVSAEDDLKELQELRLMVQESEGRKFTVAAEAATANAPVAGDLAYRQMTGQAGGDRMAYRPMLKNLQESSNEQDADQRNLAEKMMGSSSGEVQFAGEVQLESQAYWWHDKYRPRKPKYFNRVHTGYEWNKYNQTHYDHDNPPPKVVQGYKFNIFYPDLINKVEAPKYEVVADGSKHGETAMLVFHAGPPYEDIAFKIVNKDWEYSHKKGFKCSFERGIMHLYINFKRYRYRR